MKKIFTLCVVLCLSYLSMGATNLKHEFRATWLTTAWGNDWPKTQVTSDATRNQQQDELIAIFDRLQAGNMNAVCMQVRGRSDAFYQSSYEPWAAELAGARGTNPGYDPLAFAIEEAHKRGLELHAWVNPFRVTSAGTLDANDLVKKNAGQWIIQYNNGSFTGEIIDPGYPEAREYVLNVLMEIISNYDIDGIVMDDYFYPYGGTTTEDAASKALHKPANVVDVNQNGDTDDDWRRSNVDVFLEELYNQIQATKPWVRFGMGTFGIWTTQTKVAQAYGISLPSGIYGLDDYDVQACNPVEWVKNGYVDYINPQLYWPTTSTGQNYGKLCQWWAKDVCEHFSNQLTNGKKVHFFSSQSISSNSAVSEIQAQIDVNRNNLSSGSTGSVFFDTDAYLTMDNALMTSRFATHALPPAMDWKSNTALAAPTNLTVSGSTLTWQHATAERFTVYVYPKGTAWSTAKNDPAYLQGVIYGKSMDISGIDTNMNDIAVCAYDRFGVEHETAIYGATPDDVTPPASGTITYELNGGVTNEYGWQSKADMWEAFKIDAGIFVGTLDEVKAAGDPVTLICSKLADANVTAIMGMEKWDWLEAYIMEVQNAQAGTSIGAGSVPVLTAGVTSAGWRYALAAFFIEGQRTTWPYSADFLQAGKDEAYIPTWRHAFDNPTNPAEEFVLNAPYKEGYTFAGWYTTPDFSGEKVTTINAETNGTLYAKWIEYIPTIAEIRALVDNTETKVAGVVNFISVTNMYIQDATGGILVSTNDTIDYRVGDRIVAEGVRFTYAGAPEVKNAVIESAETATLYDATTFETLTPLISDSIDHKYFATRVTVPGLKIVSYDGYNNPTVTDGVNEALCYRMSLDPAQFPIGSKITITAVAGWYNGFQFVGDVAGIERKKDQYEYPVRNSETSSYTLINDWVISNNEDNFAANKPGTNDYVRGMAVKDGIMYFINRDTKSIVPVVGATAEMLDPIAITGEHLFERIGENGEWESACTLPFNDIKFDQAGNCLIGSCVSGDGTFQIYEVDLETGAATLVVEERLYDNPDFLNNGYRFDAFGVAGDVTQNGVIMAADGTSGSWNVYRWLITDGEVAPAEQITMLLDPEYDQSLFINVAGWGTAPQIFPQDEVGSLFYVDGRNMLPMLFDEGGMLVDDFINCPTQVEVTNKDGDVLKMNPGHNGLVEFQVGDEYFLLMAAGNVVASVPSCFALFKFADKGRTFDGLEPLWYFPANGMGTATNGCRTAVPSVEVVDDKTANLYLYTNNNGYARYTLNIGETIAEVIDPTWQITYTSTDGNIVTPYKTNVFGANIVSNTYENGVGTITFDGPVTSIGRHAFNNCSSLSSIVIPNTVENIGVCAFYGSSITSLDIPNSVTSLGDWAFADTPIESIAIPNSVTHIGFALLAACNSLTSIVVEEGNSNYDSRDNCNAIIEKSTNRLIATCPNTIIPNTVTTIATRAFQNSAITSIDIPNSVVRIEAYAFRWAKQLNSITIPNSVNYIGDSVFYSCPFDTIRMEAMTPPTIGVNPFDSLPVCVIPCGTLAAYEASDWASQVGGFVEDCVEGQQIYYTSTDGNIVTPYATDVFGANIVSNIYENGVGTITFDGPVTSIGEEAFYECLDLISITIPNSVESIGYEAFRMCYSLTSITIPNSVESIGYEAFRMCYSLTSITIPNSVTSIGDWAFFSCSSLTSITIPNSVTSIGDEAFYECLDLTSITIPNSVTSIGDGAFAYCSSLTSMTVENGNTVYDSRENCNAIIETATNTLIAGCQNTIIPNSVTSIGSYAFSGCSSLTSITIPNSVTSIVVYAFSGCSSLTSVTIPNSVTSIGSYAFISCSSLTSMTVENGNTVYDSRENCNAIIKTATNTLIAGCQNTIIPNNVTSIGTAAFSGCSSLTSITIPNSVTSIGENAFGRCSSLTSITIPNSVTSIGDYTFYACSSLTSVTIPNSVTSIGDWAFSDCTSLTSVTIPNSVTSIGGGAFGYCSSLETIHVEATNPPILKERAFKDTPSPTCYIPCGTFDAYQSSDWAQYVSEFIEEGCPKITYELNGGLPNEYGWQNKNDMFQACMADCGVTTLPSLDEIKATGNDAALTTICTKLTDVSGMLNSDKWEWLEQYIMEVQNAQAGTSIGAGSVSVLTAGVTSATWRYALAAFFIEGQRTTWPYSADFSQAGKDEAYIPAWKQVYTYPTSVTSEFTLYDPYRKGYTFLGWYTNADFFGEKVTTINAETTGTLYAKWINSDWIITYTSTDGNIVTPYATDVFGANIVSNTYENGVGTITFDGPVTSIGEEAFRQCSSIASITIPKSVTSIGQFAFGFCSSLTSITIPENVTSIVRGTFQGCSSIVSIVVDNNNTMYDSRNDCNAIIETATNVLVTGCKNTIIPNGITTIDRWAFASNKSLVSITIPNTVMTIADHAFHSCSSLPFISIPNSVTSIGVQAFYNCSLFSSFTIPESVTTIGKMAFNDCTSLDTINIEASTPPTLGVDAFTSSPLCNIPCGTIAAYEASDWASQVSKFVEEGCAPIQMCGDDLYWEYADGVLTIIGTGDMYDYAADTDVPWYDVRGNIKTVSLPDAMTKIGQNAFYKCTAMTSINMPTSLTAIGEKAFAQDTKLACEIILPASMTTIASRAFFNCQAVAAFHIEATTPPTIPNDAFERTTAPIHVPCGYGHVYGKHAQWGELNLEMCELLQDNVYYYPIDGHTARAVTYYSNPTDTIVIPSAVVIDGMPRTVTEVADFAFMDCANLPAIYFNEGLEYIGERAFVRCYGLQGTIVLPATLETIGERAFSYCDNVEKYLIQAMTPPALGANVFTGNNKNALFYISCEAMDDYKVATNWSSLKSRLRDACLNIYHYNTTLGANGVHTTEDTLVASIYYRRQFTTSRWETLYLPFEVDRVTVLEDGVEYDLNAWSIFSGGHYYLAKPYGIENKEIVFGFTQVVDAHTPYIIQFKEPYYHDKMITFHGKESWNKLNTSFEALPISFEMQMAGNTTLQDQILEEPVYMLRASSNFILQNTTTTLHPFECYVIPSATSSGAPARMSVRFRGDVPTAVESVMGNESHLTYTVDGYTLTVYPQGQAFSIYSLNGALIYSCEAGKEAVDCELNSGCYLLHAGTEAHKIML